jgi:hypothetical protein
LRTSRKSATRTRRQGHHLGHVGQEVVQAAVDVQPGFQRLADRRLHAVVHAPTVRRDPDHQVRGRSSPRPAELDGGRQIGHQRDSARFAVENLPGVLARRGPIDHRQHLIAPGETDQPVRGLAVRVLEVPVAVHHGHVDALAHAFLPVSTTT